MVQRSKHSIDIYDLYLDDGRYLRRFDAVVALVKNKSGVDDLNYPTWFIELVDFEPALIDKCDGSEPDYLTVTETELLFRENDSLQDFILRKAVSL